jgi:hypothetical protein
MCRKVRRAHAQLLNTISNLGGTLPKPLVLRGVDVLSQGYCSISRIPGNCASDPGKSLCEDAGGYCVVTRDGYYIMSAFCVAAGATLLVWYILPTVKRLQGAFLPASSSKRVLTRSSAHERLACQDSELTTITIILEQHLTTTGRRAVGIP